MTGNASLAARMGALILVPIAAVLVALVALGTAWQFTSLEDSFVMRGELIARQIATTLGQASAIPDRVAREALRESSIARVVVQDSQGRLIADAKPGALAGPGDAPVRAFRSTVSPAVGSVPVPVSSPGGRDQVAGPIPAAVTAYLSESTLRAERSRALLIAVLAGLIGFAVAGVAVAIALRRWCQPVNSLVHTLGRINAGASEARATNTPGGELGMLAAGINTLAEALGAARRHGSKPMHDALILENVRAQVTLESIGDGVISTDSRGRVVYMNPVAEQYTGWASSEATGQPLTEVFRIFDETTQRAEEYPLGQALKHGRVVRHDAHHLLLRRDSSRLEIQDSAAPIRDRGGLIMGAVVVFRDVTEMQHMARRMAFLASHDPLTGLLNRREFENRLNQALESARDDGTMHAVCYLDLDEFKIVNDTSGHIAGDELLKQLVHHLAREVRSGDVLARLGGDEFGVIFENCGIDKAKRLAEMLLQTIKDFRFVWQNRTYEIGASIGLVPVTADSGALTDVLSAADSACYVAKDHGRNRIHVYQVDDVALTQRHGQMQWVHRLRRGLDNNSFDLHAQAIVPLRRDAPAEAPFYEVLMRVRDGDLVMPAVFIPAAERYHLMPEIDRWVIYSTFQMLSRYYERASRWAGTQPARFSINLSGQSLGDERLLEFIVSHLVRSRIEPANICFEITETAAISNLTRAHHFIARLKKMGCRFALDDFGSGLSSFGYLKNLPVDYVKIAGDFITDMVEDAVDYAMVDAIAQIGHVMGLATVAESVESDAVIARLRQVGVDYGQGLGLDRPKPLFEVLALNENDWHEVRTQAREASL